MSLRGHYCIRILDFSAVSNLTSCFSFIFSSSAVVQGKLLNLSHTSTMLCDANIIKHNGIGIQRAICCRGHYSCPEPSGPWHGGYQCPFRISHVGMTRATCRRDFVGVCFGNSEPFLSVGQSLLKLLKTLHDPLFCKVQYHNLFQAIFHIKIYLAEPHGLVCQRNIT